MKRGDIYETRTVDGILSHFRDWLTRGWGRMNFHLTQLLTGHGCFGSYLHRIGKQPSTRYYHCCDPKDSPEHALRECFSWVCERSMLAQALGSNDLSLPAIIRAMLEDKKKWLAFSNFARAVMRAKEKEERVR